MLSYFFISCIGWGQGGLGRWGGGSHAVARPDVLPLPLLLFLSHPVCQMGDNSLTGSFLLQAGWSEGSLASSLVLVSSSVQCTEANSILQHAFSDAHSWACLIRMWVCVHIICCSSPMCRGLWVACSFLCIFKWRLPCQAVTLQHSNIWGPPPPTYLPLSPSLRNWESQNLHTRIHSLSDFFFSFCCCLRFTCHWAKI